MRRRFPLVAILFLAMPMVSAARDTPSAPLAETLDRIKIECGFDLQRWLMTSTVGAQVEPMGSNGFRALIDVQPKNWTAKAKIQFAFNCPIRAQKSLRGDALASKPIESIPSKGTSARAVIEDEDAGGRYARHVASERAICAANWQGTVAYVDSLFGDGQNTPMTFLLACDAQLSRPCIEVHVKPTIHLRGKKLESIFELLRNIGHAPL